MPINVQNVNLRISAGRIDQFPRDPIPQIALSGRSNVGKSSLINTLLGRNSLAKTSSAPGKTTTVNFYEVDRKLFFADLPGYGYAKRSRDRQAGFSSLTDGYFTKNPNADLIRMVIQLIDSRAGVTEDDAMMLDYLNRSEIPYIVVITKVDKLNKTERTVALDAVRSCEYVGKDVPIVAFSSLKGEGKTDVWKLISEMTEVH